ncbi:Na/Pi cotransporter family protein [Rhodobacteraceae bacterium RKSG542]|uniref:Na/Pi cotransporter family protein n=1 Tax=Pseudovibrio flavus TaxID=2529854 RepID=UPI0012BD461E|nr:Na/Pi cotransporter family protein [Pseudovibrio flavus]MTI17956.1 Na/Pi cotransporter family protein [Pseudovibrio flavus]
MSSLETLLYLSAGVVLLFWATRLIRTGVERALGTRFREWMMKASANRLSSFGTGLIISILLQSATGTAILARSFIARGVITTIGGLAIMLGADLGSTMVVQLLSLDMSWLLPLALVVGGLLQERSSSRTNKQIGRAVIGVGQMLIALKLIGTASASLSQNETFPAILNLVTGDPLIAILLAAALTWVVHSSVAVVLTIMTLATTGAISVESALLFVLGANIGSSFIPFVLTMNDGPEVRRVMTGNMLFRCIGVIIGAFALLTGLVDFNTFGADPARAVANFHSAFNFGVVVLGLPLAGLMIALCNRLLPERNAADEELPTDRMSLLDRKLLDEPDLAFAAAIREMMHMSEKVEMMLRGVPMAFSTKKTKTVKDLMRLDDEVDDLHRSIKEYLADVNADRMNEDDYQKYAALMNYCVCLEQIGDVIQRNLLNQAKKRAGLRYEFSKDGWREIKQLHTIVLENLQVSIQVMITGDTALARALYNRKLKVRQLEKDSRDAHLRRLQKNLQSSRNTSSMHLETISDLKTINALLTSVAYPILEENGELSISRKKLRSAEGGKKAVGAA